MRSSHSSPDRGAIHEPPDASLGCEWNEEPVPAGRHKCPRTLGPGFSFNLSSRTRGTAALAGADISETGVQRSNADKNKKSIPAETRFVAYASSSGTGRHASGRLLFFARTQSNPTAGSGECRKPSQASEKLRSGTLCEGHDFSRAVKVFTTSRSSTACGSLSATKIGFWAPCLSPP